MVVRKDVKWIRRGKQKRLVLQVITHPVTPTEIMKKAQKINPKITFGDTSTLIQRFTRHDILECLTPEQSTGRIYFLTDYGRRLIHLAFNLDIPPKQEAVNWNKISHLKAGKTRQIILNAIYYLKGYYPDGINLTSIRKKLRQIYPMTLSQTFYTVQDLLDDELIKVAGHAKKYNSKLYKLTKEGTQLCEYLSAISKEHHNYCF
jgi:DNA-binding HxlR family transcriptional regulator